jgi:DNA repair protein RecO (recombination protein O)
MLHKTSGVVFRLTKYGETSIIVSIFTSLFGLQSYIVNGVRSKSTKSRIALYQPLMLLDMVVYHRAHASINRVKEVKCIHPYQSIFNDVKKSSIAMFINEVMNKTIKEESHAEEVCTFLIESLITLDTLKENTENFHLLFMLKLSRFLGFGAHHVNEVVAGKMTTTEVEDIISILLRTPYGQPVEMSYGQRREILDLLLQFYGDHVETFGELKSVQVLKEILG